MHTLKTVSSLVILFLFALVANGQSAEARSNIKGERFYLKIIVVEDGQFSISNMIKTSGESMEMELIDSSDLSSLKLALGSVIEGTFSFESFSSDGGLGGTRVMKGKGTLRFSKVVDTKGNSIVCPPLCRKSVKIGLRIN